MTTYSHSQMLSIWRSILGLNTAYSECSIEQFDGININELIALRMRQWYLDLLHNADPSLLPVANIASQCARIARPNGATFVEPPADCVRVVEVRAATWPVALAPSPDNAPLKRLGHPYAAPSPSSPIAVSSRRGILLAPCDAADALEIIAVTDPGADSYILDQSLLSSIPSIL